MAYTGVMVNGKRVISYYRVSTDDQGEHGMGMAAQEDAISSACQQHKWEVVNTFHDVKSGGSMRRPGLAQALSAMAAGEADILVGAKLDRISRSVVDFGNLIETAQKQGWSLVVLDLGLDMSTPVGEFVANMMANVAQFERRRIGERTRDAMAQIPRGPHTVTLKNGDRVVRQAPGRAREISADVEKIVKYHRDNGMSLRTIAAVLDDMGQPTPSGGKWQVSTIQRILART